MYGYNQMLDDIGRLTGSRLQTEVQVLCIGKSVMGRQLLVIKIGPGRAGEKVHFHKRRPPWAGVYYLPVFNAGSILFGKK